MDCDQVFMILTRGPFPTGESWDEDVETHLETCGGCWRIAEALRPALEVFQEAVPPAEGRDLPGYWGDARPSSSSVAQLTRRATKTYVASEIKRARQPYISYLSQPLATELSTDVFRGVAIVAMLGAAAAAIFTMVTG
jgi:hypothetical protein